MSQYDTASKAGMTCCGKQDTRALLKNQTGWVQSVTIEPTACLHYFSFENVNQHLFLLLGLRPEHKMHDDHNDHENSKITGVQQFNEAFP